MKSRCTNKKVSSYKSHGARGISVCARWDNSYENFMDDMGRAPTKDHSLERIDNNGNYEPGNCKWATRIEQSNNKRNNTRIEFNGSIKTLAEWCREYSQTPLRVCARLRYGWSSQEAMLTPLMK